MLDQGLGVIPPSPSFIVNRPLDCFDADKAALQALVQAAVNVELFTIPLYMCAMKSIQGMHEINAKDVDYYKGRVWPGRSIGQVPKEGEPEFASQKAYNLLFSVFIDEMLHLQMAANLCASLGVKPDFNSRLLQDEHYNWTCYGPDKTVIPHIVDLNDLDVDYPYAKCVSLAELNKDQVGLFKLIEEDHDDAREVIKKGDYFPGVPFVGWDKDKKEADLPMFGTIGWMYYCVLQYMSIAYVDDPAGKTPPGRTLWEKVFLGPVGQRDLFNYRSADVQKDPHTMSEYKFETQITAPKGEDRSAYVQAVNMICAICDQGEGSLPVATVNAFIENIKGECAPPAFGFKNESDHDVLPIYQPDKSALETDYPSYDNMGGKTSASNDATARADNGAKDHYQRFKDIDGLLPLPSFLAWPQWHAAHSDGWTCEMLVNAGNCGTPTNIPKPKEVADALNGLKASSADKALLDNAVTGALAGITQVLSKSWTDATVDFPFPSMVGSGDRMALYWAVYGEAPTLQASSSALAANELWHACQSLTLDTPLNDVCATPQAYHSCKGSNACCVQGGCGFVQPVTGGHGCSQLTQPVNASCAPVIYSAPADNHCRSFGGCAVPISASQLYPCSGTMKLYDRDSQGKMVELLTPDGTQVETLTFNKGDSVYDTAWAALEKVWAHRGETTPRTKPPADKLRIALPPST
ncbi:ferritin-like domain-containing protein [Pseudomonas oryzihabitans]|uniref:ferritin-like domain-containing protein n=1 Tax=Pseudomonas oryzihabitans TaxID=47885 RepID=UPI0028676811|nr:ferritin-like domain-containing protein [Pseudomonas psychrotolerans]MDR6679608.1 hypothetical protein [Pseudomonas psychrotolerans]